MWTSCTCLLKARICCNVGNWSSYPADQRSLLRNPNTNAFWRQRCLIKVNSAAKKEKRKMFFCHWQRNTANYIGVNAGKAQTKVKMQLKMQWLGEVAKIKAEQGGEGLIHPVLPLIPSRCDGWLQSPTGSSITESTSAVQAASAVVPLPCKAESLVETRTAGNWVSYDKPRRTHPGIIRERLSWAE